MFLVVKQQSMQLVLPVLGDNMVFISKLLYISLWHMDKNLCIILLYLLFVSGLPFFHMCCVI